VLLVVPSGTERRKRIMARRWSYEESDTITEAFLKVISYKNDLMKTPIWDNMVDGKPKGWRTDYTRYCKHGTNVGDPYGPDYLCGYCEDDTPDQVLEDKAYMLRLEQVAENWEAFALDLALHLEHGLPFESQLKELKIGVLPS
tara:strand:- start:450 stop:878 length:429 start_codon:yes stop_codon:yes gene_type:complete